MRRYNTDMYKMEREMGRRRSVARRRKQLSARPRLGDGARREPKLLSYPGVFRRIKIKVYAVKAKAKVWIQADAGCEVYDWNRPMAWKAVASRKIS